MDKEKDGKVEAGGCTRAGIAQDGPTEYVSLRYVKRNGWDSGSFRQRDEGMTLGKDKKTGAKAEPYLIYSEKGEYGWNSGLYQGETGNMVGKWSRKELECWHQPRCGVFILVKHLSILSRKERTIMGF